MFRRSPVCWTMPVTTSLTRSMYSSYIISRSASRIRCKMTCFAVWAAMRPKFSGVTSVRLTSAGSTADQSICRSSSDTRTCECSPDSSSCSSSSVIARSRASSIRRSSMSFGSSIAKTRKSPLSGSSSTLAWRDAPGVFLYAAWRASSRAWIRVSSSIPFSFSIVLTASMISLLMSSSPFVDEVAPHDLAVRDHNGLAAAGAEAQGAFVCRDHLAAKALAAADLVLGAHGDLPADGIAEVRGRAQRPLDARRGDVDGVPVQVAAEQVGNPLAERVVDARGVVDVDREPLAPGELDREHLDARKALLHGCRHLSRQLSLPLVDCCQTTSYTRNGRRAPISPSR